MAAARRNLSLAALMLALVAAAALALPSAMWACLVATLLGLAGVVLFRGNGWRTGALLASAVALSLALLDAFAGLLTPTAHGAGLVRTVEPRWWPQPHPVLGFRPMPDSTAVAHATFNGQPVYHETYHIDSEGGRATPKRAPGTDLYLFLGDSFMFGQGISDNDTLPWLFAEAGDGKVRTLNLSAPGNAPNHLVRAFEAGLLDRYLGQPVKAVIVWIIPAQLARTTGDGSWLGSSPRYELVDGKLVHTGSFTEYRLTHPIAGLKYYLGELFPFVASIGEKQRQEEQLRLFVAMMARLQQYAREKFNAPLVVVYSWPDEKTGGPHGDSVIDQSELVNVITQMRKLGIELVRVDDLTSGHPTDKLLIPYDGHPLRFTNELIAGELKKRLRKP
jgi:hypothetical protein